MFRIRCIQGHPALHADGAHGFGEFILVFEQGVAQTDDSHVGSFLLSNFPGKFEVEEVTPKENSKDGSNDRIDKYLSTMGKEPAAKAKYQFKRKQAKQVKSSSK